MSVTLQDAGAEVAVRAATDAEVRHYHQNGWVKMERLIAPELAAEMLKRAKVEILEKQVDDERSHERHQYRDMYNLGRDDMVEPFASLNRSKVIGRNAQRFMRRDAPIGFHTDMLLVKMPDGHVSSQPTGFHQDFPQHPLDRAGMLVFWIALDDLTPEQGVMRFYSGSQKEGPLGRRAQTDGERGLIEYYKYIEDEYPLSPPLHMKAGDCTIHSSLVIHGAPANVTSRPRWTYLMAYHPSDACWTGAPSPIFNAEAGLKVGEPIRSPKFPIIIGA